MNIGKYVPIVATLIVAVVVMTGVVFPTIGGLSSETTTISNDGASWIRMGYITDQSDYSVEYTFGDNISVAGQSGEWEDMILYADSQCTVCIVGDYIVKIVGDVAYTSDDPQTITVSRSNGIVSIDGEPVSESPVSWAYVPVANGIYSSFGADTVPLHRNSELAVVGGFAGVYAYNENVSMDLGFVMDADVSEEYINSVRWALESEIPVEETQPFHPIDPGMFDPGILNPGTDDPSVIDDPSDPSTLDPQYIDPDIGGNIIMSVPTPTYTDGDWGFDIDAYNRATIVSYSGTGGNLTVPTTVTYGGNTYNVGYFGKGTSGSTVFDNANISDFTLTFPSGWGNGINDRAIKSYCCQGCTHLKSVSIETSITYGIGSYAFQNCTGLQTFSSTVSVSLSGSQVFDGCTSLSTVSFDKIEYLGSNAFRGCTSLSGDITISVSQIGSGAFYGCTSIGTMTATASVQMASEMFYGCTSMTELHLTYTRNMFPTITSMCEGCTNLSVVELVGVKEISGSAFKGCTSLESITIPASVTKIQGEAFSNTGLETITIPNTVTTLGNGIFSSCASLTNVTFNLGLTAIPDYMFQNCTALESAVLPVTVTSIGAYAFAGCTSIWELTVPDQITTIGQGAFRGCTSMGPTLILPVTVTSIGNDAFAECSSIKNLIVMTDAIPTAGDQTHKEAFEDSGIVEVLNLSSNEWTTTSYGLNAEEVRADIGATSYMAPVSISETTIREGPTFDVLAILPIVFVAGLLLTTAWLFIRK